MNQQYLPHKQKIYWSDNTQYFFTTSTLLHYPYFTNNTQKQIVLNQISLLKKVLNIPVLAYSIAINHFHVKFYLKSGNVMSKVKNILHSGISREYRKIYPTRHQEFWQSNRIYYIKDENMSWKVSGYIAGNLLKHKEVGTFNELKENQFSSFRYLVDKFGDEAARSIVYQVIDVSENNEGDVDFVGLQNIQFKKM